MTAKIDTLTGAISTATTNVAAKSSRRACYVFRSSERPQASPNRRADALHRLGDPLQILGATTLDGNRNALRQLVRVKFQNGGAYLFFPLLNSLDQQQELLRMFHLALPAIH